MDAKKYAIVKRGLHQQLELTRRAAKQQLRWAVEWEMGDEEIANMREAIALIDKTFEKIGNE